jgi:hypothetical protein
MNDDGTQRASNSGRYFAWAAALLKRLNFGGFLAVMLTLAFAVLGGAAVVSALVQGQPLSLKEIAAMAGVWLVMLAILVPGLAILDWAVSKFNKSRNPPSEVAFDGEEIRYSGPRQETRRMAWRGLAQVLIVTTDGGPFVEDLFWILVSRSGEKLAMENGAKGVSALLAEMQSRLPGFDNEALVKAVGSTCCAVFEVWRAPDGASSHQ